MSSRKNKIVSYVFVCENIKDKIISLIYLYRDVFGLITKNGAKVTAADVGTYAVYMPNEM